jgi:hypothetical protein
MKNNPAMFGCSIINHPAIGDPRMETLHIYLGKLSYFTNLNTSAIDGMISLYFRHGSRVREDSEVAIKFTQIHH